MYFKNDNGNLLEAPCVEGFGYSLPIGGADPVDGWHWLTGEVAAREFFGMPQLPEEDSP